MGQKATTSHSPLYRSFFSVSAYPRTPIDGRKTQIRQFLLHFTCTDTHKSPSLTRCENNIGLIFRIAFVRYKATASHSPLYRSFFSVSAYTRTLLGGRKTQIRQFLRICAVSADLVKLPCVYSYGKQGVFPINSHISRYRIRFTAVKRRPTAKSENFSSNGE